MRLLLRTLLIVIAALVAPVAAVGQSAGTWTNVTPTGVNLTDQLDCGNYGTQSVVGDPTRPSNFYAQFMCQGFWKSTDYGQTWQGPINTGAGGSAAGDSAGGLAIATGAAGGPPILYQAGIRGAGTGFWRSLDGGVSWTRFNIGPAGSRQDVYPPVVDPYDPNHLLITAHEQDGIYQSVDGGQTWTNVPIAGGMHVVGGTGFVFFINTGTASSTRNTWLWTSQGTGGVIGTWRTTNGGTSWTRVDSNEHPHGAQQNYQPDTHGVVYMAGVYSALGWGALRSTDYGQTWAHVGSSGSESTVYGTPNYTYVDYGIGGSAPSQESAPNSTMVWTSQTAPAGMSSGAAASAVSYNGTSYVIVTANWQAGLWRYVEAAGGATPTPTPAIPTATPTSIPTSTPTAVPVATSTPVPTQTPVACQVLVTVNGAEHAFNRPASFCTDQ